jgi:arsenate reductase-like glutaredoxin family protein
MMRFFGLKTCDTCRKALSALRETGHQPLVIDVRADGIAPSDLAAMLAALGDGAVNKSSATWRALSEEERRAPGAELIAAHPTLLKRPVIEAGGVWHQGWSPAVQRALME